MKILIISDLHLCDTRNSVSFETRRLNRLREFIANSGADLVLNLGDTVSRQEFLRPEFPDLESGYRYYLEWRKTIGLPFVECAVNRERRFFAQLLGQEPDYICKLIPDLTIITLDPMWHADHVFSETQIDFLVAALKNSTAPRILIATHVPYPGSCSRPITPGIYLEIPEQLRVLVEESSRPILWCGGHFHWSEEPPRQFGALTVFYGGRFCFESIAGKNGYLRMVDATTGAIRTLARDIVW